MHDHECFPHLARQNGARAFDNATMSARCASVESFGVTGPIRRSNSACHVAKASWKGSAPTNHEVPKKRSKASSSASSEIRASAAANASTMLASSRVMAFAELSLAKLMDGVTFRNVQD